jgi:hypothetical protein
VTGATPTIALAMYVISRGSVAGPLAISTSLIEPSGPTLTTVAVRGVSDESTSRRGP